MARRNDHSRDELRDMALKAAELILDREGVSGLTTRKIATEIGYAVGSLYFVFANLDDLITQINVRSLDMLGSWLDKAVAEADNPTNALSAAGRCYLHFATLYPGRWSLIFEPVAGGAPVLSDDYQARVASLFERVEKQLIRLAPERQANEVALAARTLWGGVHGICTLALGDRLELPGMSQAEQLTANLIQNYLRGWMSSAHDHGGPRESADAGPGTT